MKKSIALYPLIAAALLAASTGVRAADQPAAKPDAAKPAASSATKHVLPFHGKVVAVDTKAMTLTVGSQTFNITSDTKITKDGKPATLADLATGEIVRGAYKKDSAGKLNATTIHVMTPNGAKKKPAASPEKN
jgi:hypothetical protein